MLTDQVRAEAREALRRFGDIPKGLLYTLAIGNESGPATEAAAELEAMRPAGSKPYDYTDRR